MSDSAYGRQGRVENDVEQFEEIGSMGKRVMGCDCLCMAFWLVFSLQINSISKIPMIFGNAAQKQNWQKIMLKCTEEYSSLQPCTNSGFEE